MENDKQAKIVKEQDENLENDQLESVAGGATECSCDCWIGNSNGTKQPEQPKEELGDK